MPFFNPASMMFSFSFSSKNDFRVPSMITVTSHSDCPACGNGQVEYPETCDQGTTNGPCQPCNQNCRTFTCDDQDPCTTDRCDPLAGCTHTTIPGCTTTTTTLLTTTTTSSTTTTTICGDVNGDGVVSIGDALVVAQFSVGLRQCGVAPFSQPTACNVNGDSACDIGDALRMAQCDVGLVSCAFSCTPFVCQ